MLHKKQKLLFTITQNISQFIIITKGVVVITRMVIVVNFISIKCARFSSQTCLQLSFHLFNVPLGTHDTFFSGRISPPAGRNIIMSKPLLSMNHKIYLLIRERIRGDNTLSTSTQESRLSSVSKSSFEMPLPLKGILFNQQ